jgi:hypothetical protein
LRRETLVLSKASVEVLVGRLAKNKTKIKKAEEVK